MEYDNELITEITEAPAFRRKWKRTSKHKPERYLPDDDEYKLMQVCTSAAGDNITTGAEWYESRPLSDVYRWLAVRLASIDDTQ